MKNAKLLLLCLCLLGACKTKTLTVDYYIYNSFTVSNELAEAIDLIFNIGDDNYTIPIAAGKDYSYTINLESGNVKEDKIPVFSSNSLKIETDKGQSIVLNEPLNFVSKTSQEGNHYFYELVINSTFWEKHQ